MQQYLFCITVIKDINSEMAKEPNKSKENKKNNKTKQLRLIERK
jgi:hypothetical protein